MDSGIYKDAPPLRQREPAARRDSGSIKMRVTIAAGYSVPIRASIKMPLHCGSWHVNARPCGGFGHL